MCRQLTILEDYLDENLKSAVKNLFIKSLALESESTGASEQLLTTDNMKLLQDVNDHLFAQLEKIPPKILHIYRRILLQLAAFYETAQKWSFRQLIKFIEEQRLYTTEGTKTDRPDKIY